MRLDQHEELIDYLENKTDWGKDKTRLEEKARAALPAPTNPSARERFARVLRTIFKKHRQDG